jgi:hypothetical protein
MSRPALSLVHSTDRPVQRPSYQMGLVNLLDRLPDLDPGQLRRDMPVRWGRFIRATMRDREVAAAVYGVTFQTACNWWDDAVVPLGDKVAIGAMGWPAEFGRIVLGQGCGLRAVA